MQNSPGKVKFSIVLPILVLVGSGSILSTDLYAPSLPYLTDHFSTSPELIKLTISLNLIIYGFAQLIYGPISDRFGRRPVFLWSLSLFAIASVGCGVAQSIDQLLIARVLQGFFAAAEAVVCLAVFKDIFSENEQIKAFAIYGMAIALTPALAPIVGGYIHVFFGWEYNFYLTAAVGISSAILIYLLLPESATPDPHALRARTIIRSYTRILCNRTFMLYTLLSSIGLGYIYTFITAAPFILISYFDVPTQQFGYYQAVIVSAYFFGSLMATRLVDQIGPTQVLNLGLISCVLGALSLVWLVFFGDLSPYTLTLSNVFIAFGIGPIFAVSPSRAMSSIKKSAGSAAAVFGSLEVGLSGLIAVMVSIYHDDTARPYGAVIGFCALSTILLGILANRSDKKWKVVR